MPAKNLSPEQILLHCGKQFYERRWMWGTAGNLSIRLPAASKRAPSASPLRIAITPSGLNKGHLSVGDLITIEDGRPPRHPRGLVPSAETVIHQAIYRVVPDAQAAFHVHPVYSTLLSSFFGHPKEIRFLKVEWFEMMKGVGVGEEESAEVAILPNWQDVSLIAKDLTSYVEGARRNSRKIIPVVLIHNHGLTAWGKTADQARNHLEIMEYVCHYLYLQQLAQP